MGLFQYTRELRSLFHPSDHAAAGLFGGGYQTASGVVVTPDSAMREATVYGCVRIISDSVATLPLKVYKKRQEGGGKDEAPFHPLNFVLSHRPNKSLSSVEFRRLSVALLLLRGNAVAKIISTGGNAVAELIPLDPDRLEIKRGRNGRRVYEYHAGDNDDLYYHQSSGKTEIYLQDEVLHIMGQSLNGGLSGLSPISYHRETIGAAVAIKEFGARLFKNGTHIGSILETDKPLKQSARDNLEKSLVSGFSSVVNAGKTLILEDGMKLAKVGMTSEDAQYLESRKFSRAEIAGSIFGVPPHKIGELERSTNNNIEHQGIEYVTDCLLPHIRVHEDAFLRDLFSEADVRRGYFAEFNFMGLLRGDSAARAAYYRDRFNTASISPNRIRELENENPEKGGDKCYIMTNMVPIDQAGVIPDSKVQRDE